MNPERDKFALFVSIYEGVWVDLDQNKWLFFTNRHDVQAIVDQISLYTACNKYLGHFKTTQEIGKHGRKKLIHRGYYIGLFV